MYKRPKIDWNDPYDFSKLLLDTVPNSENALTQINIWITKRLRSDISDA